MKQLRHRLVSLTYIITMIPFPFFQRTAPFIHCYSFSCFPFSFESSKHHQMKDPLIRAGLLFGDFLVQSCVPVMVSAHRWRLPIRGTLWAQQISRSFFADSSIHALRFLSLLLRLLSFDFSLCILLAQAGQYFDIPELGTYSTPHTVQFLGFNAVHRFVGVICNSPTKPMNL